MLIFLVIISNVCLVFGTRKNGLDAIEYYLMVQIFTINYLMVEHSRMTNLKLDSIISTISKIFCYGGTIYMMAILFSQYNKNLDSSQASLKGFNELPTGRYPSFTVCIYAKKGKLLKDEVLQKRFGISKKVYYNLLKGDLDTTNSNFTKIPFGDVIFGVQDFFKMFGARDYSHLTYNLWKVKDKNATEFPLSWSYQDPTTNCFTYETENNSTVSLSSILFELDIKKLEDLVGESAKLYIHAHYPGQLIRNTKTYLMNILVSDQMKLRRRLNQYMIRISGVTLMRFRDTANDACDPTIIDDDAEWKKRVVQKVGCSPSYWNNNSINHREHHKICSSKEELALIRKYLPRNGKFLAHEIFKTYPKPCNKMIINNSILNNYYEKQKTLMIKITLQDEFYHEILNTRDFGMADLWASIGGYVGVFCGYSVLHATDYLIDTLKGFSIGKKK